MSAPPLPKGVTADAIIRRMKEVCEVETDEELGEILGLKKTTISSWRRRNSLPLHECLRISLWKFTDLDYLVFGTKKIWNDRIDGGVVDAELMRLAVDDFHRTFESLRAQITDDERWSDFRAGMITREYNRYNELLQQAVGTGGMAKQRVLKSLREAATVKPSGGATDVQDEGTQSRPQSAKSSPPRTRRKAAKRQKSSGSGPLDDH